MSIRLARPRFSDAGGLSAAMQIPPPFDFAGVTIRAFPLRARMHALRSFVDGYVNVIPEEAGTFRPFVPYVYLLVVNYGRMAVEAANLGWLSQREIVFTIPVEWYRRVGGKYVFHDWAFVSPFIYVDSELSMTTGRQVYGWPKSMVQIDPELGGWMDSPRRPLRMATISAMVFPETYAGQQQTPRVLLELLQASPWSRIAPATSVRESLAVAGDLASAFREVGLLRDHPGRSLAGWAERIQRLAGKLDPRERNLACNAINLKQFRSAAAADLACYQAVTNSLMALRAFNDGGLLGGAGVLTGDPSGGFDLHVHRYETHPIVESLGLEVDREWRADGVNVARLKPVFPFWLDIDVRYGLGETLASRTMRSGWRGPGDRRLPPPPRLRGGAGGDHPRYITASGAALEVAGPFHLPNTTLRVLPLVAQPARLQRLCDDYLNRPLAGRDLDHAPLEAEERRFEAWGRYVYLVAANHEQVASDANNVGWWADRDVTFYVPVKWYEVERGKPRRLKTVALVPVFSYANTATAAITGSEVSGIPMLKVDIESPPSTWMDPAGPAGNAERPYLRMTSTVFPSVGEGMGARAKALLEVREGHAYAEYQGAAWRHVAETWGRTLKSELERKKRERAEAPGLFRDARALALEILGNGRPINLVTLKQFRDVADPSVACYQSLVLIRRRLTQIFDVQEIETPLSVSLFDYPSQPIAKKLGLVATATRQLPEGRAQILQPVRPFWMRVAMRQDLGITMQARAGDAAWDDGPAHHANGSAFYFTAKEAPAVEEGAPAPRRVGPSIDDRLQIHEPRRLRWQTQAWQEKDGPSLDVARAAAAVQATEPQMILESILSREWEHWGTPRWEAARRKLLKGLEEVTAGLLPQAVPEAETQSLAKRYEDVRARNELRGRLDLMPKHDRVASLRRAADKLARLEHGAELLKLAATADPGAKARALYADALELFDTDELFALVIEGMANAGADVEGIRTAARANAKAEPRPRLPARSFPRVEPRALVAAGAAAALALPEAQLTSAAEWLALAGVDLGAALGLLADAMKVDAAINPKAVPIKRLSDLLARIGCDLHRVDLRVIAQHLQDRVDLQPILRWIEAARLDVSAFDVLAVVSLRFSTVDLPALIAWLSGLPREAIAAAVACVVEAAKRPDTPLDEVFGGAPGGFIRILAQHGVTTMGHLQRLAPFVVLAGRLGRTANPSETFRRGAASAVQSAKKGYEQEREHLVMWLARAEQKPDFCVSCQSVLTRAQGELFPDDERWSDDWYMGPAPQAPKG